MYDLKVRRGRGDGWDAARTREQEWKVTLGSIAVVQIRNPGLGHGASSEEESTNSMCILVDVANSL